MSKPKNATFYNNGSSLNGIWGNGNLISKPVGSPTILNGMIDLTGDLVKYIEFDALDNADSGQVGCIRIRGIWNYSGVPTISNKCLFSVLSVAGAPTNIMQLTHITNGDLNLDLYDNLGNAPGFSIENGFSPVAGEEFEFEVNYDLANGLFYIFKNGIPYGLPPITQYLRGQLNKFRIGSQGDAETNSDFYIKDFLVFDKIQHANSYTPDWSTIPPAYPNNVSKCLCYGYVQDFCGAINTPSVTFKLNKEVVNYKNSIFQTNTTYTAQVDQSTGYFSINLTENTNMEADSYYIMTIKGIEFKVVVNDEQIRNLSGINQKIPIVDNRR